MDCAAIRLRCIEVVNGQAVLLLIELLLVLISGVTAAIVIDTQLGLLVVVSQKGRKELLFELALEKQCFSPLFHFLSCISKKSP